jgi:hypothetical protein
MLARAASTGRSQAMLKPTRRLAVALLIGASMLSSCATYDGVVYGSYYNGYYDGYYGPYLGGYWASDGLFWYLAPDHRYHRDTNRHFRHDRFPNSTHFRGERGWPKNRPPPGNPAGPHAPRTPDHDQRPGQRR